MGWLKQADVYARVSEALSGFSVDVDTAEKWIKGSGEFSQIKKGIRIGFEIDQVEKWIEGVGQNCVLLDSEDYKNCFEFAVEAYYHKMTKSDFNRGKRRDVGEFLTNQIEGKLGEIALKKHLEKFGLKIDLDFSVTGDIPSQDITKISYRGKVWTNPDVKVSIKATKFKNTLLLIPENEVALPDRRSDVYVLSHVGLFSDHLLRILKTEDPEILRKGKDLVPDFTEFPARIGGWISLQEMIATPALTKEELTVQLGFTPGGSNFLVRTGRMNLDWNEFKRILVG